METRLNKYLSEAGFCSRREADRLIDANRVTVNDNLPEKGLKVTENDVIKVDDKIIIKAIVPVYIALNKPVGITSTTDLEIEDNIITFMDYPERIFHVGRLDKASQGLIFMTNDGDIVNKILRAGNKHEKEYIVTVDKPISNAFLNSLSKGVPILNTTTKECVIKRIDDYRFNIILTEGLNRQIRRMCDYYGYQVRVLKRTRIMNVKLDLQIGKWRELTLEEITELKRLVNPSSKTA
ncbi:MAG: pseudouridine synthase [Candidatus Izemoplasma sp.]